MAERAICSRAGTESASKRDTHMLFVVIVVLQNSFKMLMLSALVDVIHDYVQSEAQIDIKATYFYQHLPWFSVCGVE